MKYIILSLVLGAFICGCNSDGYESSKEQSEPSQGQIEIVVVDGCQYLIYTAFYKGGITHKGNCNNPIHKK